MKLLDQLEKTVDRLNAKLVSRERRENLQTLINYIQGKMNKMEEANLNFICTHNSRRSQLAQIWSQTAAGYFGVTTNCFSGGVEVTHFNERVVESIKRAGFEVTFGEGDNPRYTVLYAEKIHPIIAFSKLFDDPINPSEKFAAIMTCSHADENCPFIPGTEKRIPVRYEDPKEYDGSPLESAKYDERSMQIAAEMFYVFSKIKTTP